MFISLFKHSKGLSVRCKISVIRNVKMGLQRYQGFICEVGGVTWVGWGCNHLIPSKGVEIFGGGGAGLQNVTPFQYNFIIRTVTYLL